MVTHWQNRELCPVARRRCQIEEKAMREVFRTAWNTAVAPAGATVNKRANRAGPWHGSASSDTQTTVNKRAKRQHATAASERKKSRSAARSAGQQTVQSARRKKSWTFSGCGELVRRVNFTHWIMPGARHAARSMKGLPQSLRGLAGESIALTWGDRVMEQRFETTPRAEIWLQGRRVTRTEVTGDWGLRLQWVIRRNGQVVATAPARADMSYEHADATPGNYEISLQMWKYVNYRKNPAGEFLDSRYVGISNKVSYTI
jgi:hypothetical protein